MSVKLLIALVCLAPSRASAGEGAAFLKLGVGARAFGMGGAYTAVANDVSAIAWNPAGLSSVAKKELGASHAELAADTRQDFIGYAQPTSYGTFGVGAAYLSQGVIGGRDQTGRVAPGYTASDLALNLAYAKGFDSSLRMGGGVKYIQSRIAEVSAQTFAVDLGGQYEFEKTGPGHPQLGLAVLNLGPGIKFLDERSALPLTVAVGAGYRLPVGLLWTIDYKQRPSSGSSEVNVGAEHRVLSSFAIRAGYSRSGASGGTGALDGFAAGFGIKSRGYTLDYSMAPFGELGLIQRFSLGAKF